MGNKKMNKDYIDNAKKSIVSSLKEMHDALTTLNDDTSKVMEKLNGRENNGKIDNLVRSFLMLHGMCGGLNAIDTYMKDILSGKENLTDPFPKKEENKDDDKQQS